MSEFKDDITGRPLVVSNKSTQAIIMALVAANRASAITDEQYRLTYAEVCEIGYEPQGFGGKRVDEHELSRWKSLRSWA